MLSSITPLGQRGRDSSWGRTVIAYWIGAVLAGVAVYGLLGGVGEILRLTSLPGWVVFVGVGVAAVLDGLGMTVPGPRRQVNENWLGRYRDWVTGLGFGLQLGTGLMTIVPLWGVWTLVVAALVVGVPGSVALGASFALGRSVLLMTTRDVDRPDRLARLMERLARLDQPSLRLVLGGYAVVLVMGALIAG